MKIFADRHHAGLTNSLLLLFQDRLGYQVFFQKGMEWHPEFWDLQPFEVTARQYLERELEGLPGITLEDFKKTQFDLLLCSVPQHVPMWLKLQQLYQPQAKLCFQVGNMWSFDSSFPIKNILASAKIPKLNGFNQVEYHQNFDTTIFHSVPAGQTGQISAFINCLGIVDLYRPDWDLFLRLESLLPEYQFKSFGGQCRDGAVAPESEVAKKMQEADFIFHCKTAGDGFGHTIHQAAASGRPIITRYSDYAGKLAEPLIIPGLTAITIDGNSPENIAANIRNWQIDTGEMIRDNFEAVVNFNQEEIAIRNFLDQLL